MAEHALPRRLDATVGLTQDGADRSDAAAPTEQVARGDQLLLGDEPAPEGGIRGDEGTQGYALEP